MTKAELYYAVAVPPRREHDSIALLEFLRYIEVLDFPDDAASHYGEIRSFLKEIAQMIGANDLFLAAHARCLDMTIVNDNTRHFGRVPSLKVDHWVNR